MRRITWMLTILMSFAILMVGCGQKDAASVVKELDQKMTKLDSYAGIGTMTLRSGQQPLEYQVEVWYQGPSFYRIELTNAKKDVKQIVLRNEEGVFVLTPSLKKSFRFQSDWPNNQGQVYLYQTLVRSILEDNNRQFEKEGDSYIFEVSANYQTDSLVKQKIWLNTSDYKPKHVQVTDAESRVVLEMKFDQFEFNKKFDKDAFDMQRNMTASANIDPGAGVLDPFTQVTDGQDAQNATTPTMTVPEPGAEGTDKAADPADNQNAPSQDGGSEGTSQIEDQDSVNMGPFGIIEPNYTPTGTELKDTVEIPNDENHSVLLRYTGTYNYTIMESRPKDIETSMLTGQSFDLVFTVGQLTGGEQQTLTWMEDGVKYRLTSADLPVTEMKMIAQSMVEQSGK